MPVTKFKIFNLSQAKPMMAAQIQQMDLKAKPHIFRIEIKIKPIDALDWLDAQGSIVKIYGANQDNSAAIAGISEAWVLKGEAIGSFASVFKQMRQYLSPQYPYLQWYGGFCFDEAYADRDWKEFGAYRFVLPRFELARDKDKMIFCCNLIGPLSEAQRKVILRELDAIVLPVKSGADVLKAQARRDKPSSSQWELNVAQVLKAIDQERYSKVVLARKTVLTFSKPLNPFTIFRQLHQVTPNSYHFCFQFGKTTFLGASPERLYKRQGRMVLSEAIAGTSRRGKTTLEDKVFKDSLMASVKDNNEHQFVVDAIDSQLSPLCVNLQHEAKPEVISLNNGHHLITPFTGQLKDGIKDEDILKSLHPTPAVAGTPRKKAMAVIRRLESFSRGWYAGPLGYVGLDWAEFVVGIRSGFVNGNTLSVYAGAGIVKGSQSFSEWDEIENKISNFIKVIK